MTGFKASEGGGVLLIAVEDPGWAPLLDAMEAASLAVEWARSLGELQSRAARDDVRTPQLVFLDLEFPAAATEQLVRLVREHFPLATTVALAAKLTGEVAARLLSQGVPSLTKPVSPLALTGLALRLSLGPGSPWSTRPWTARPGSRLESIASAYAVGRVLSKQQQMILRLYLDGKNDKEIAEICRCSEATVYEHWRRMARKAGGSQKGDVITDFHRFLGSD
jgi:DNA-binding NarL/FixJ family response regulator